MTNENNRKLIRATIAGLVGLVLASSGRKLHKDSIEKFGVGTMGIVATYMLYQGLRMPSKEEYTGCPDYQI